MSWDFGSFGLPRLFPPNPPGTTYVRQSCGARHWWWPPPKKSSKCLCGRETWK